MDQTEVSTNEVQGLVAALGQLPSDPEARLRMLVEVHALTHAATVAVVAELRERGYSWAALGVLFGRSKQTTRRRFVGLTG